MNISAINAELAKIGYKAVKVRTKEAKGRRACHMPNGNVIYTTWYRNPSLADISKPYGKFMRFK